MHKKYPMWSELAVHFWFFFRRRRREMNESGINSLLTLKFFFLLEKSERGGSSWTWKLIVQTPHFICNIYMTYHMDIYIFSLYYQFLSRIMISLRILKYSTCSFCFTKIARHCKGFIIHL